MIYKTTQWGIKRQRDGAILSTYFLFTKPLGNNVIDNPIRLYHNKGAAEREIYRMNKNAYPDDVLECFPIQIEFENEFKPYVPPQRI